MRALRAAFLMRLSSLCLAGALSATLRSSAGAQRSPNTDDFAGVAAIGASLTVAYVGVNFAVDVLYTVLDPRIRHGAR